MGKRQKAIERTCADWRTLGFYYHQEGQTWYLVGNEAGLSRFAELLREYAADPRRIELSEHEHYGPYMYLEIMTWTKPGIDGHAISGRLEDLTRLSELIKSRLAERKPGDKFTIGKDYAPDAEFQIQFEIHNDGFDPSSLDSMEWANAYED